MRKVCLMSAALAIFSLGICHDVPAYDECSYYDHNVPCTLPGNPSIILDSVMGNAAGMIGYFVGACYEETDWYNQNGDPYADLHVLENPIPENCAYYHASKSYLWLSSDSVFGGFGGANFLKDSGFFWNSSTGYGAEGINENFESLSIGLIDGQGNWTSGPTGGWDSISEVVSSPTHSGSRSLHLSGFVSNATFTVENPTPPDSPVTVSFWYREQYGFGTNDNGNNMSLRNAITLSDGNNLHTTYANICHAGTGHRSVLMTADPIGNGSCINGVGDIAEGNWYFIEIEYDFENRTARARIDGGDWGTAIDLRVYGGAGGSYITSFSAMSLWDNPPQFWFDDFGQTTPTPPTEDGFVWPVEYPLEINDYQEIFSSGHYGSCTEWPEEPDGCFWLSDTSTAQDTVWRDVQPFQKNYWKYKGISGRHLGADYNIRSGDLDKGEFVYAVAKGVISKVDKQPSWGNIIYIRHDTSFGTFTSMYAHVDFLDTGAPTVNSPVDLGTPIAKVGKGTYSDKRGRLAQGTWPAHLHFELREGDSTDQGIGYTRCKNAYDTSPQCIMTIGPQGQIDPNAFIAVHR